MSTAPAPTTSRGPSTFQFVLFSVIPAIVGPAMDQFDADPETVKIVGRACAAFALVLIGWGLFTKMIRIVGIIIGLIVVTSVLVSEGVIEPPKIAEAFQEHREDKK